MGDRSVTFKNGNDKAIIRNGDKTTTETMEDEALMFTEKGMYVPLRSMQNIFDLAEVDWDPATNTVIIFTDESNKPAA